MCPSPKVLGVDKPDSSDPSDDAPVSSCLGMMTCIQVFRTKTSSEFLSGIGLKEEKGLCVGNPQTYFDRIVVVVRSGIRCEKIEALAIVCRVTL